MTDDGAASAPAAGTGGWAAPGHEGRDPGSAAGQAARSVPGQYSAAPSPGTSDVYGNSIGAHPFPGVGPAPRPPQPSAAQQAAWQSSGVTAPAAGAGPANAFTVGDAHRQSVFAGPGYASPASRNDRVAVTAMVLGIIGIVIPGICLFAVALGHVALHRLRNSYHGGRGLAIAGLVLGYIMTAVWLSVLILRLVINSID